MECIYIFYSLFTIYLSDFVYILVKATARKNLKKNYKGQQQQSSFKIVYILILPQI